MSNWEIGEILFIVVFIIGTTGFAIFVYGEIESNNDMLDLCEDNNGEYVAHHGPACLINGIPYPMVEAKSGWKILIKCDANCVTDESGGKE